MTNIQVYYDRNKIELITYFKILTVMSHNGLNVLNMLIVCFKNLKKKNKKFKLCFVLLFCFPALNYLWCGLPGCKPGRGGGGGGVL